jgi:hypothetical protein
MHNLIACWNTKVYGIIVGKHIEKGSTDKTSCLELNKNITAPFSLQVAASVVPGQTHREKA